MLLKRFYDERLAQASYLIACQKTGDALVVDATRDIEMYVAAAAAEGVSITAVTETHIHADFASGSLELARRTGGRLHLSAEGGPDWQYGFADAANAILLRDADSIMIGNIRVDVIHTPGHTPEHLSFLVTDCAGADAPMGMLTGDFIFVGDVGRPDLLERAAGFEGTMRAGAAQLYASLQKVRSYPEYLQIWPGHGSGSACGKALGAVPQSTLGYEKLFNWAFRSPNEEAFIEEVLSGQPDPPTYFAEMKRLNKKGPAILAGRPAPPTLDAATLEKLLASGAIVVDARSSRAFAAGHVPGTINLPGSRSLLRWGGWFLPYDQDIYLIGDGTRPDVAATLARDLSLIGLDRVAGFFGDQVIAEWASAGGHVQQTPQMAPSELASRKDVVIIDVRNQSEWDAGQIPGAVHIPLGQLPKRLSEVPHDEPVVLQCEGGTRSSIAAGVLQKFGYSNVLNLTGGFDAWSRARLPVVNASPAETLQLATSISE
jgi:hydroxyacylglutathione hydrolase